MEHMNKSTCKQHLDDSIELKLSSLLFSAELEELEDSLNGFNIFEAIGAVNSELRHSNFLGFLLDPSQNHGLMSKCLSNFLYHFFNEFDVNNAPSLIDVGCYDYSDFSVEREWRNIDILIVSERYRFVLAIENKIWSGEHSDQLTRYQKIIEEQYPSYKRYYALLTPSGLPPENNEDWVAISYEDISEILHKTLKKVKSTSSNSVVFAIEQYLQMIERHILEDTDISKLCKKIYKQHKQALDLIFEHRPDKASETYDLLSKYLEKNQETLNIDLAHSSKSYVRFSPKEWGEFDIQKSGTGEWASTERTLLFEFVNRVDSIILVLIIGPNDGEQRNIIFEHACDNKQIFKNVRSKKLANKWHRIYNISISKKSKSVNHDEDEEAFNNQIIKNIDEFFAGDYKKIKESIVRVLSDNS
ncbi:hypothetical protein CMT41_07700 [Colwellia sp. MT41]|nr:hypothetical protein CMT41_07700 [Colwellia sp. MT41]